uniref:Putative acetylcholinesterase/butyrylcholinesterase n=1 Tax=Ixodes ricinus TaxID=34613 RepID=A0A6B0V944_IXORI
MMPTPAALVILLVFCSCSGGNEVVRETRHGKVRGKKVETLGATVEEYKGIPYAEAPVGDLRFKEPVPRSPWEGTLDANLEGIACPQINVLRPLKLELTYMEDCLFLNVWTPENAQGRNVLVWIHGGGFVCESAFMPYYSGLALAAKTGFVVVSMNYRLGILGFLNADSPDAPGNQGLLDQALALRSPKDKFPSWMGTPHGYDISYFFGSPLIADAHFTAEDKSFSEDIINMLTSFAENGLPELPNGNTWPKYSEASSISVVLAPNNFTDIHAFRKEECELWRKYA